MKKYNVGFIGLGNVGSKIANNILIQSQEPKWFEYPNVTCILANLLMKYNYENINSI